MREGSVLRTGAAIRGVDLAGMPDERCPATPEPPAAVASPPPATPPRVTLGSFANASGVVDAQRLSCAEIADASPEEARLFLASTPAARADVADVAVEAQRRVHSPRPSRRPSW